MADSITAKLEGAEELSQLLRAAPEKIRKLAIRGALRKAGRVVSAAAKAAAPVLAVPTKTRRPGTVKRAIRVASSKFARRAGDEGVFIGVRPLRGARQAKLGKAGAKNPNDPYFWWWQELGWVPRRSKKTTSNARVGMVPGKRFMTNAAKTHSEAAIRIFMSQATANIQKINRGTHP